MSVRVPSRSRWGLLAVAALLLVAACDGSSVGVGLRWTGRHPSAG